MKKQAPLKGKKLKFAHYYGHHENATLAAKQAGYSERTANQKGSDLLREPKIRELVDILISDRMARLEITGEKILKELAKIAFADISDIVDLANNSITVEDFAKLTPDQRACIASAKKDKHGNIILTFHDKIAALTKLGQSQKLFTDVQESKHTFNRMGNVEITDSTGQRVPLEFNIGREPDDVVN